MLDDKTNEEKFPNISSTASMSECTGLMPTIPENEEAYEAYQELSGMEIPKQKPKKK
jgi:hypothetical protein